MKNTRVVDIIKLFSKGNKYNKIAKRSSAALLALGMALAFNGCALENSNSSSDDVVITMPTTPTPESTESVEEGIELSYETISEDAAKFLESVDNTIGTKHNYTQEEVEEWIKNLFALNTEIIAPTEVSAQIDRILELMQVEIHLRVNKFFKENYSTPSDAIDWSLIVPDKFKQADTLMKQIYAQRLGLAKSLSKDEALQYSQEIINIIGDSWYAGGYDNAIPVGKLETSGARVLTMTYMMMSQIIADAVPENGHIYVGPEYVCYDGVIGSSEMMQRLNKVPEDCETELNEFSAALWGVAGENNINTEINKLRYSKGR